MLHLPPHEVAGKSPIKDLPTNMFIKRDDKRTFEILPGISFRLVAASILHIRRKKIESLMKVSIRTSSRDAKYIYVPHEYQWPIRDAVNVFLEASIR